MDEGKLEVVAEIPIKYEPGEGVKILVQLLPGLFLAFTGVIASLGGFSLGLLAYPVIIIGVLGAINAVNLIDGMDGLAAGIIAIASFACCVYGYMFGNPSALYPFGLLTAICLGFLVFNKYPASIFMGDTGSFILGTGYAAAVLLTDMPYFGVFALAVPIVSTIISLMHRAHIIKGGFKSQRADQFRRLFLDRRILAGGGVCCQQRAEGIEGILFVKITHRTGSFFG